MGMDLLGYRMNTMNDHACLPWARSLEAHWAAEARNRRRIVNIAALPEGTEDRDLVLTAFAL